MASGPARRSGRQRDRRHVPDATGARRRRLTLASPPPDRYSRSNNDRILNQRPPMPRARRPLALEPLEDRACPTDGTSLTTIGSGSDAQGDYTLQINSTGRVAVMQLGA